MKIKIEDVSLKGCTLIFQTGSVLDFSCILLISVQQQDNASQTSLSCCWSNPTHKLHQKQHQHLVADRKCFSFWLKLISLLVSSLQVWSHVSHLHVWQKPLSVGTAQTSRCVIKSKGVYCSTLPRPHNVWMYKQCEGSFSPVNLITYRFI